MFPEKNTYLGALTLVFVFPKKYGFFPLKNISYVSSCSGNVCNNIYRKHIELLMCFLKNVVFDFS